VKETAMTTSKIITEEREGAIRELENY
jgi:hypothetical protein